MVKQYDIIRGKNREELVNKVNELLGLGWEPIGGVSIAMGDWGPIWTQAIVKIEKERKYTGYEGPH